MAGRWDAEHPAQASLKPRQDPPANHVYWPDLRFAVELDLFETHGSRAAFERDRRRQEELKLLGIEMIRVTAPRLKREPQAVIRNLATLLERRQQELASWSQRHRAELGTP